MNVKTVDNSGWPKRKVLGARPARADNPHLKCYVMLECGHEVGVKLGFDVPTVVPCYMCFKIASSV